MFDIMTEMFDRPGNAFTTNLSAFLLRGAGNYISQSRDITIRSSAAARTSTENSRVSAQETKLTNIPWADGRQTGLTTS